MEGKRALIGREQALDAARGALDEAAAGRGRWVLVRGEPGIGKTAFAAAIAAEAEARGGSVVLGRAWELAEAPPYFPVWPCMRALGLEPPGPGESDAFRLWERVLESLARASERRFVCWVLEDLHAADLLTLDLLTFLVQPLRALRVFVLGTARARDPRITPRANERFVRLARGGLHLELQRLGRAEVARLAEQVAGRVLAPNIVSDLDELTGGNPLFIVECARALRTAGAAPRAIVSLPGTARQVVLERVDYLPDATREALGAAAILGREVTAGAVARVLETMPARVIDALQPAIDAGIVAELRPACFGFSHALVQSAIEDAVTPAWRAELHARAAAALANAGDATEVLVERARHALAAMRPDGGAVALALRAAARLEDLRAFDRALSMYERIDEARRAGLAPPATPEQSLHVAEVARLAGRHAEARSRALAVFDDALARGDGVIMAHAALALGATIRPAVIDPRLVGALEAAQRALGDRDAALSCRVLARLGAALQPADDPGAPIAMVTEAMRRARALGDGALVLEVLHVGSAALVDSAPADVRQTVFSELLERAEAAGELEKAVRAQTLLAVDFAELGEFSRFYDAVDRALAISDRLGHPRWRWRPLLLSSMRAVARGDLATSERAIVEVQAFVALTDDPAVTLSLGAHLGQVTRLLHRDEEMRAMLSSLLSSSSMPEVHESGVIASLLRCAVFVRLEDRDAAAREVTALRDKVQAYSGFFAAMYAEACAFLGDSEACAAWRAKLASSAGRHVVSGHVPLTYEGSFDRVLALLDSALGDHGSAEARLGAALEQARRAALRTVEAQLDYDLGVVLERAGRHSEAAAAFADAARLGEAFAMGGLVARARARTKSVPSRPTPRAAIAGPPLTMQREGDVWCVAFRGRDVRIKDSRGVQLLARLVERPGEEMHVLALASDEQGASLADSGAGDALDARAKREYKARLDELARELDAAERDADAARTARLAREKAALEAELAHAFGLGARGRRSGSASERARVNVQRRIKDAIARIAEADAPLGEFLEKAVRTGTYCRFFV